MYDDRDALEKLKEVLGGLDETKPDAEWSTELKARVLARSGGLRPATGRFRLNAARRIAALAAAFVFSSGGVVYAASGVMPDSPLYPLKRSLEKAALIVTSGHAETGLKRAFSARREAEARYLSKHEDAPGRSRARKAVDELHEKVPPPPVAGNGRVKKSKPVTDHEPKFPQRSRKPAKPGV